MTYPEDWSSMVLYQQSPLKNPRTARCMKFDKTFDFQLFLQCGRSYEPNFLFLWPNARIGLLDATRLSWSDQKDEGWTDEKEFSAQLYRLKEESSAFYSSARIWDDGVILPEDTRPVSICTMISKACAYDSGLAPW
ncbi:hypothetical protein GDO78_018014 [Eleutherodactylus coqui]|uniref:Uncharacterized protein n=1 Tax=Eleutherodactylus coqui TaxID=57060 RepID=A0A8J6BM77_ELECQ|nr:hypothetical protein GDO78_018014 [Eleutherodactylus coqui]